VFGGVAKLKEELCVPVNVRGDEAANKPSGGKTGVEVNSLVGQEDEELLRVEDAGGVGVVDERNDLEGSIVGGVGDNDVVRA